jgi:hypothetical protein
LNALLACELRRMLSRRLVRLFAALAVLGILIAGVAVYFASNGRHEFDLTSLIDVF